MKRNLLLILLSLLPLVASAYDAYIDGIYYNFLGDEAEVTYGYMGYLENDSYNGAVIIPNSVAYNDKTYSVSSIGEQAFVYCAGLTSITIPNSVTSIGENAFRQCTGLTSVTIPNSVASIGEHAFQQCTGLTSVTIPNSVASIGGGTFCYCTGLTSITIPNSVTSIGEQAFSRCTGLTSVSIPSSVTSIGLYAFEDCSNITSLDLDCDNFDRYCFYNSLDSLRTLTLGPNVRSIDYNVFYDATNITNLNLDCETIGHWFDSCRESLKVLILGTNVKTIDNSAFYGCHNLTSVTIPNSVTTIGDYAFQNCIGLTSIIIPKSVTSIGRGAFNKCEGLIYIEVETENTNYNSPNGCNVIIETATNTLIASGSHNTTIPDGVTSIEYGVFEGRSDLTSVIIPNSLTNIGSSAFEGCTGLTSITIPNNVTNIGSYAFGGCTGLTSVTIPNSVTKIGSGAFRGCKLRNVLIKCSTPPVADKSSFSEQTLYHTILYIPTGCWGAYAYDDAWYKFINIRESAMEEEQLSTEQAYTLMDVQTYSYFVYDPINNSIGTISSLGVEENNPNHNWQMVESGGARYLYNMGAGKYARRDSEGLKLLDQPEAIGIENGENGLVLDQQTSQQCVFVSNEHLNADQAIITGIECLMPALSNGEGTVYDLNGRRVTTPVKGIFIRNGKKVLVE